MPPDPTVDVPPDEHLDTTPDGIGHVAPDFSDRKLFNTLVVRPEYRISLRIGNIEELFENAPDTDKGRMERLQVVGLFYYPLKHKRAKDLTALKGIPAAPDAATGLTAPAARGAWEHFTTKILAGGDGDAGLQDRLKNWVIEGGTLPAPADDPDHPLPANFAKLRIPGGYTFLSDPTFGKNNDAAYPMPFPGNHTQDYRYGVETKYYTDNPILRKIPLVALVERRNPDTTDWEVVKDATVYFQLVKPYDLPDFVEATAVNAQVNRPPLRQSSVGGATGDSTAVAHASGAGPNKFVQAQEARNPASLPDTDPQRHNCPQDRGGEAGKGNAADGSNVAGVIFETASRTGFNTVGPRTKHKAYLVAEKADVSGTRHQHSVKAKTNEDGEAGVIFMPSRCGGDRYRIKAYIGQAGTLVSDGTGTQAVNVETGTLVVWRSIRLSRYVRMPLNDPHADLLNDAINVTATRVYPNQVTNNDEYLLQGFAARGPAPYTRVGLPRTDLDPAAKAAGTFCELNKPFDRFMAQLAKAFCDVEIDPDAEETLTNDEWQAARANALIAGTAEATNRGMTLDLRRLFNMETGNPITVSDAVCNLPMRSPAAYHVPFPTGDTHRLASWGGPAANSDANLLGDNTHNALVDYLLYAHLRALAHNGFLPGLTIVQGLYGFTWQLYGIIANYSGLAMPFRGAYVWAGAAGYPDNVTVPPTGWPAGAWQSYNYTSNSIHEMGHVLYRPHAPGKNPGRNPGGVGNNAQYTWHDGLGDALCVMSYKACEGQYCGRCLLAFRGWNMTGV